MDRISTVTGSGPVMVDNTDAGHCAYEINVYRDDKGRVIGRGHVMGDSLVLGRMARGQNVVISADGHRFGLVPGGWQPGDRRMDVETGPDVMH